MRQIVLGVLVTFLAGTASAGCFEQVTERLNEEPLELDFTAKSSDQVVFRFLAEWAKEYRSCLPLDVGDFRMIDIFPTPDRAVVYVFEYLGKDELVPDDDARREIWSSMHQTYCKEEMLLSRGVRLVYSIRDRHGGDVLKLEVKPDTCSVKQALRAMG